MVAVLLSVFWLVTGAHGEEHKNSVRPPDPFVTKYEGIHAGENDCQSVRLDAPGTPSGPMANVPVRDQSELGSCTAHAAAILIDAYQAKRFPPPSLNGPPNHLTSPLALYVEHQKSADFQGPFTGDSGADIPGMIDTADKAGSCDMGDEKYDTKKFEELNEDLQTYDRIVGWIADMKADKPIKNPEGKVRVLSKEVKAMAIKNLEANKARILAQIECLSAERFRLPSGVIESLHVAKYLDAHEQAKFWKQLLDERCVYPATLRKADEIALPPLAVETRLKGTQQGANKSLADLQKSIDANLDLARQPVGIGYCTSFFSQDPPSTTDGAAVLTKLNEAKTDKVRDELRAKCGMHASAIMGRNWRRGGDGKMHCMYLIHNSWGADKSSCLVYAEKRRLGPDGTSSAGADCEGGKVWIDQAELTNVVDVNFFKPK